MFSKYGNHRLPTRVKDLLLASSALTMVAAGVFAYSAGQILQTSQQSDPVTVDFGRLAWWSDVNYGLDHREDAVAPVVYGPVAAPHLSGTTHFFASDAGPVHQTHKNSSIEVSKSPQHLVKAAAPSIPRHRHSQTQAAAAKMNIQDQVASTQAAPSAVLAPAMQVALVNSAQTLRLMHYSLRIRFMEAVNELKPMTTQVARAESPASSDAIAGIDFDAADSASIPDVTTQDEAETAPIKKPKTLVNTQVTVAQPIASAPATALASNSTVSSTSAPHSPESTDPIPHPVSASAATAPVLTSVAHTADDSQTQILPQVPTAAVRVGAPVKTPDPAAEMTVNSQSIADDEIGLPAARAIAPSVELADEEARLARSHLDPSMGSQSKVLDGSERSDSGESANADMTKVVMKTAGRTRVLTTQPQTEYSKTKAEYPRRDPDSLPTQVGAQYASNLPVPGSSDQTKTDLPTDLTSFRQRMNELKGADQLSAATPTQLPAPVAPAVPLSAPEVRSSLLSRHKTLDTGIEAFFDWESPVTIQTELYSSEGPTSGTQGHWTRSTAVGYVPTLFWNSAVTPSTAVPMISKNTSLMLAGAQGATVQPDSGIVFGRLAAGWTVQFKGRAETPVFIDEKRNFTPSQQSDRDRYFAFMNTEPGAHLLYLVDARGATRSAIAVPVVSGGATYVDLYHLQKISITGHLYDASASRLKAASPAAMTVVGQASASTTTRRDGYFEFRDLLVAADHPLFFEASDAAGYTHRYRVDPSHRESLRLFRFSSKQVTSWVNQLEGGVSPNSGLVVGAFPDLIQANPRAKFQPSLHSIVGSSDLTPETYTLDSQDHLQVKQPVTVASPRFLSVQVPEGATEFQLDDESSRATAWSMLLFNSPGIVFVLGPD